MAALLLEEMAGGGLNSQIANPYGGFVDASGNIYISDYQFNRVMKWTPGASSGIIVAGQNSSTPVYDSSGLYGPEGCWVDASGNVYVADANNHRVQKWAPGATYGVTVAGQSNGSHGHATNQLFNPAGVYVDSSGNIFVADFNNNRIQKWAQGASSGVTVAGDSSAVAGDDSTRLQNPTGVFVDRNGNIYVSDQYNNRVQKFTLNSAINNAYTPIVAGSYTATVYNGSQVVTTSSITIGANPAITLGANPVVCTGVTSASLPYTAPTGSPTQYSITWSSAAQTGAGFVNVSNVSLPAGAITLNVPGGAGSGTYTGTLSVSNATGCVSAAQTIGVTVNTSVSISLGANPTICQGTTSASLPYTSTTGLPTQYSINWGPSATSAGFAAVSNATLPAGAITLSAPGAAPAGTYTGTLIVGNGSGCTSVGQAFNVIVSASPSIISGVSPSVCSGLTSTSLPYTVTSGSPTQYSISWSSSAASAGFTVVTNAGLPAGAITINVPGAASAGSYTGTLTVKNVSSCSSIGSAFNVTVNPLPNITLGSNTASICSGTTIASFPYTATGAPASYTVIYDANAQAAGLVNITNAVLGASPVALPVPSAISTGTYHGVISVNSSAGCTSSAVQSFSILVNANATTPTINISSSQTNTICAGQQVTFTAAITNGGSNPVYQWYINGSAVGSNNSQYTTSSLNNGDIVSCVLTSNNPCITTTTASSSPIVMTVHPLPTLNSSLSANVCSNVLFQYTPTSTTAGAAFAWTRAVVAGVSNAASSGSGGPAETFHNTSTNPVNVIYVYTLTANGCTNPSTYNVVVTVNPSIATVTLNVNAVNPFCQGTTVLFSASPGNGGNTPNYQWYKNNIPVGTNSALYTDNALITSDFISVTMTSNATCASPAVVSSNSFTASVITPPSVAVQVQNTGICSGSNASFSISASGSSLTYQWQENHGTGFNNISNGGVYNGTTTHTLNISGAPLIMNGYTYRVLISGSCGFTTTSAIATLSVSNPAALSSAPAASVCNNTVFHYIPTGNVANTSFAWSRNAAAGISNSAATGYDDPAETFINTTSNAVNVTYVYTLTDNGCTSPSTYNVNVTVNPTPTVAALSSQLACDGTFSTSVQFTGTSLAYSWTNTNTTVGLPSFGSGDISPFMLHDTSSISAVVDTVTVTPTYNGCNGAPQSFTYTVKPTPVMNAIPNLAVCNGTYSSPVFFYGTAPNYVWTTSNSSIGLASFGTGATIPSFVAQGQANATVIDSVSVTPISYGCNGTQQTFYISVNPNPPAPIIDIKPSQTLCSSQYSAMSFGTSYTAATGTYYAWSVSNADILGVGAGGQNCLVRFPNPGASEVTLTSYYTNTLCSTSTSDNLTLSSSVPVNDGVIYYNNQFICLDNQDYVNPSPDFSGKYYWVIILNEGCYQKIYYNPPATGINQLSGTKAAMKMYPNPGTDIVNVELTSVNSGNADVQISDLSGKMIFKTVTQNNKCTLNIYGLSPGVYFVSAYIDHVLVSSNTLIKN